MADAGDEQVRQWHLKDQNEFRFELEPTETISIKLLNGHAEWFGSELPQDEVFEFSGTAGCIFTWYGCDIEVTGKTVHANIYPKSDTMMSSYTAVHSVLEERRKRAKEVGTQGPRVLITGPPDCGKSSLTRMLLAYASRLGWQPLLVDLDLGASLIGVPGSIGTTLVTRSPAVGGSFEEDDSLQYFYGSLDIEHNPRLLSLLLNNMAENTNARLEKQDHERASGLVVNTMPCAGPADKRFIEEAVEALKIDVVIVLGQRLFRELEEVFKTKPGVETVHLKPSGGIEAKSDVQRTAGLKQHLLQYFYGPANELSPKRQTRLFSELQIFELGGGLAAPSSALPIGEETTVDPLELLPVHKSPETLLNVLCAVSLATELDQVRDAPVSGFIVISDVDVHKQTVTFIAPTSGIPSNIFLVGNALPQFAM